MKFKNSQCEALNADNSPVTVNASFLFTEATTVNKDPTETVYLNNTRIGEGLVSFNHKVGQGIISNLMNVEDPADIELVVDKLKLNLNRTNSNASCNSTTSLIDSGYISSSDLLDSNPASSSSAISTPTSTCISTYTLLNNNNSKKTNSSHLYDTVFAEPLRVTVGYYGKAKTTLELTEQASSSKIAVDNDQLIVRDNPNFLNYGDDVGLVLNKTACDQQRQDNQPIVAVNQYYFVVADGVSANRSRGYDPSLFPSALLQTCADYILSNDCCMSVAAEEEEQDEELKTTASEENLCCELLERKLEIVDESDSVSEKYAEEEEECSYYQLNEVYNVGMFNDDISEDKAALIASNDQTTANTSLAESEAETKYLFNALSNAHDSVQDQRVYGSSTVCLLSLKMKNRDTVSGTSNCLLSTCNLGDSGYMIISDKQVVFKSQTQSHRFNAPFQIGCTPPELLDHDLYRDK